MRKVPKLKQIHVVKADLGYVIIYALDEGGILWQKFGSDPWKQVNRDAE